MPRESTDAVVVEIEGRQLRLSNLEKVMYPEIGFTKGQVIDYYTRIAPVLLPHLAGRPMTLKRYPNGVDGKFFYEKQCPRHAPEWVETIAVPTSARVIDFCMVDDLATLVWIANLASLELHPYLGRRRDVGVPTKITFDLDPGPPAGIEQCAEVAVALRDLLAKFDLVLFPKTSGSKGMQLELPINTAVTYDEIKSFARAIAQLMEKRMPELVVSRMDKVVRKSKVFIDWSQNDESKTTVSVYSLRARSTDTVSTPITWDEVETRRHLSFTTGEVLARVETLGDVHAGVETLEQELPKLG